MEVQGLQKADGKGLTQASLADFWLWEGNLATVCFH